MESRADMRDGGTTRGKQKQKGSARPTASTMHERQQARKLDAVDTTIMHDKPQARKQGGRVDSSTMHGTSSKKQGIVVGKCALQSLFEID